MSRGEAEGASSTGALPGELRLLCACQAALSFGLGLAFPFFAIYLNRQRGLAMTAVGLALSASVLAAGLSQALGGMLSDRLGPRRVMVLALWARAASVSALAFAVQARVSPVAVIALHIASSLVSHFFEPSARGWIADHARSHERHRAYALLRMATYAGFAVGPALGGLLAGRSYAYAFAACAAVCAVCAVAVALLLPRAGVVRSRDENPAALFEGTGIDPSYRFLCLNFALLAAAMAQFVVPLTIYATSDLGLADSQVGFLLSLNALFVVAAQVPSIRLFQGVRLTFVACCGALVYAVGFAGVGLARGLVGLACAVAVLSLGDILVPPAVQALAANMAPERVQGRYQGAFGLAHQLGSAVGPSAGLAALAFAKARGLPGHWFAVAAVAATAALGFLALGRRLLPDEEGLLEETF